MTDIIKITAQHHVIDEILSNLENSTLGAGIKVKYEVTVKVINHYSKMLEFVVKNGFKADAADFFWFGFHCGEKY